MPADVTMATKFTISEDESEPSEEVEESETDQSPGEPEQRALPQGRHTLTVPVPRTTGKEHSYHSDPRPILQMPSKLVGFHTFEIKKANVQARSEAQK